MALRTIKVKKENFHLQFKSDISKIQDALFDRGFYATAEQCAELWELYSETFAAGWLCVGDSSKEELFNCLKPFFEEGPQGSVDTRYL